jgi:hypothetical protein
MTDEPKALDRDVLGMLAAAFPEAPVPDAARGRILSKVESRIALLPVGGAVEGPTSALARGAGPASWIASHPFLAVTAAFAVGGATVAALSAVFRETKVEERVVYVERSEPAPRAPAPASPASASVPVEALPLAKPQPSAPPPELGTGERLAAESAVLDVARAALAAGDGEHALQAVDRHAASFPRGLLTEEREALGIRALLSLGRSTEARGRLSRFRARYRESLFLPAIESALKNAPPDQGTGAR